MILGDSRCEGRSLLPLHWLCCWRRPKIAVDLKSKLRGAAEMREDVRVPESPDRPGVIIFPPLLMALGLATMVTLHWIWPLRLPGRPVAVAIGIILSVLGVATTASSRKIMVKGGTNVNPLQATTAIVTSGPFRYTRNPWWGLIVLVPLVLILHNGVILREERYLERKFGEDYLRYKRSVRRYF
jgi:protein-S-isoprenylcysteine O-methyltransferase Ste14